MQFSKVLVAAFASLAAAQNMSLCDKYTTALLMTNNATNQYTVLTLVVNTALIGNYTPTLNKGVAVTGILNKGMYNNVSVNLLPYFDGSLLSSNRAGKPTGVNFLDDGGAAPLMKNMASAGNTTSNQYMLVTHLYSFFGALLGCSTLGQMGFPAYGGNTNMAQVHQYMDLNPTQLGYFIQEVGLSALSFGVTMDDATAVGKALNQHFGYRCGPVESIIPQSAAQNQSICSDSTCPVAANSSCSGISPAVAPSFANGTMITNPTTTNQSNSSGSGTGTGPSSSSSSAAAAPLEMAGLSGIMGLAGLVAAALI